jgi:serine protease AprX
MLFLLSLALAAQTPAQDLAPARAAASLASTTSTNAIIGQAAMLPVEAQDDGVPLPEPAIWRESQRGDELVQPASGDPFFLGFAAGRYYPPLGERIDPRLAQIAANPAADGRPAPQTYAFVMFAQRMTDDRVARLQALGARVLQFHPHYCLKIAMPSSALDAIAGLDFVRWIGVEPTWQKVHPLLANLLAGQAAGQPVDVWISTFDSDLGADSKSFAVGTVHEADPDAVMRAGTSQAQPRIWMSNGWQQRALEGLGIEVREYVDSLRAFRARVTPGQLEALLARDFVQFVEADLPDEPQHDESMPLINADRTRVNYDGCMGATAHVGVVDSGMYIAHTALDPYVVGWEYSTDGTNAFDDGCQHGTHVSGTILGNGDVDPSWTGAAPGSGCFNLARVFVAKIFDGSCSSLGVSLSAVYTQMHTNYTDGSGNLTARPHVINNSYGLSYSGTPYVGTEVGPRLIDDEVYDWNQLHVFAAGNAGPGSSGGTLTDKGTSKNALTVGSVLDFHDAAIGDPGTLADSSSRGPCGDNRWKPNLCAPGRWIHSTLAGTSTGYWDDSGTSMACPHVTGVAAQLVDHYGFLQYNPAALSAVMMAGAITKDDVTLALPSTSYTNHLNMYGTGRIDAYKAFGGDSQQALYMWSWSESTSYGQVDFPVNAGATRVTIVMHYKEQAASAGASAALINNLDTYIDVSPFSAGGNTGDYTAQQSTRDNTEIRIITNPTAATWRIKVYPTSVAAGQTCKVGVCAIITYGDTTPTPTLDVAAVDSYIKPNQLDSVSAHYTNPSYIASAVFLDSTSTASIQQTNTFLVDGAIADLTNNQQNGADVLLGDVIHGSTRIANWRLSWPTEGIKSFSVQARSDNALDVTDSATVYVDGTPPPLPVSLHSTTHTLNVWSNNPNIAFAWTQPADAISGVDGYSETLAHAAALPDTTKDINAVTTFGQALDPLTDSGTWYFNLRPVDKSGNWNATYTDVGPFLFDFVQPNYVTGLTSTTHAIGSHSCNPNITVTWDPTPDGGGSGMAGYYWNWSHVASESPGVGNPPLGVVTSFASALPASSQPWYFHITPFDHAGNVQNFFDVGPFYIVDPTPIVYCTGKTNSQGCVPSVGSTGTPSKSGGNFTVICTSVINQKNGLCFWGHSSLATPFQGGTLCVGAPTVRTPNISSGGSASGNDCSGTYSFAFDTAYMNANSIDPGDTIFAQFWMRDPAVASTTGLSNAIRFTVCE